MYGDGGFVSVCGRMVVKGGWGKVSLHISSSIHKSEDIDARPFSVGMRPLNSACSKKSEGLQPFDSQRLMLHMQMINRVGHAKVKVVSSSTGKCLVR